MKEGTTGLTSGESENTIPPRLEEGPILFLHQGKGTLHALH